MSGAFGSKRVQLAVPSGGAITDGLVGWWRMDEGSGTTVGDSSGNANTGTTYNSPSWTTGAPVAGGSAISIDHASNQRVSIIESAELAPSQFTLAAWVALTGPGVRTDGNYVASKGRSNVQPYVSYGVSHREDIDSFQAVLGTTEPAFYTLQGTTPIDINSNWHHVAETFDGTTLKLYVDGTLDATHATDFSAKTINYALSGSTDPADTYPDLTRDTLVFGGYYLASSAASKRAIDGDLDDVRVYSRALSAAEIFAIAEGTG